MLLAKQHPKMKHWQWLSWLKQNVAFDQKTVWDYMRLYEGSAKLGNIPNLTDASALLVDKHRKRSERTTRERKHKAGKEEKADQALLVADEYRLIHSGSARWIDRRGKGRGRSHRSASALFFFRK
jgi:hypothetical protein